MSAAGIKIATTTAANSYVAAASADAGSVLGNTTTNNETDNNGSCTALLNENVAAENMSFYNLPSVKEHQTTTSSSPENILINNTQNNKVPLENFQQTTTENEAEIQQQQLQQQQISPTETVGTNGDLMLNELTKNHHLKQTSTGGEDVVDITATTTQMSPGLSLLQQTAAASSPPPHSYRHSRAYRHFKNPPQPHMCIRTTTEAGEELFINVLSWTRIVIPQEPSDPIPLYGGMRVPPGSPRSPPIVFAVMANPEVLKDSGRHSKDPEERRAMVELMCDFVEAMNPGVKLVRNAVILKDRDISGELKDVWNAVQAQRDREREEQMLLQRQQHQQHFHNLTNNTSNTNGTTTAANNANSLATTQQMFPKSQTGEGMLMTIDGGTPPRSRKIIHEVQTKDNLTASNNEQELDAVDTLAKLNTNNQMSLALLAEHLDNKISLNSENEQNDENHLQQQNQNILTNDALSNGNNSKITLMSDNVNNKMDLNNQLNVINCNKDQQQTINGCSANNCNETIEVSNVPKTIIATSTNQHTTQTNAAASVANNIPALNPTTTTPITKPASNNTPSTQQATPPPKKEKLGGFLPNGCIFPRFTKNNKHKDKDKDKEKETKTKDKEKNVLLSALKKSKDKKSNQAAAAAAAAASAAASNLNQDNDKNTSTTNNSNNTTTTATNNCNLTNKQQKNCLQQLESGVQKLDLNNHHHNASSATPHLNIDNISSSNNTSTSSNNTNTTNTNNTGSVGVH